MTSRMTEEREDGGEPLLQMTQERFDRILHQTCLLALRIMYDKHQIEVVLAEDPAWDLLREVAEGKTTVNRSPADYLPSEISAEAAQREWDDINEIVMKDRIIAQRILTDQARMYEKEAGTPPD